MSTTAVAKKRKPDEKKKLGRIGLRAEASWIEQVIAEAERVGVSLAGYVRMAVNEKMDRDGRKPDAN